MIAASVAAIAAGIAALVGGAAIYYFKCYRDNREVKVLQAKLDKLTNIKVEDSKANVNRAEDSSAINLQPNRLFGELMTNHVTTSPRWGANRPPHSTQDQEMQMVNLFALRRLSGDGSKERSRSAQVLDGRIRAKQNGPMHSAGQYQIPVLDHNPTTRQQNAAI